MKRKINRITPRLPAGSYQTFHVDSPRDTTVVTACKDAGCLAWRYGWETKIDESIDLGKTQADYIRQKSGRTFREQKSGGLTVFRFDSGQRCFAEHRTRPEIFRVTGGDWRGNPRGLREVTHKRPIDWVENFGEHQQKLSDLRKEGIGDG